MAGTGRGPARPRRPGSGSWNAKSASSSVLTRSCWRLRVSSRQCRCRPGRAGRAGGELGPALSGDHPAVAQRLGAVHPVPGLRHRDTQGPVQHQRDRVAERPLPPGSQGQRPFPDRAGGPEAPLPGHPVPGPDRDRPHQVGDAVEARFERLRDNLRRPVPRRRNLLTQMPETPLARQTPAVPTGISNALGTNWAKRE